MKPIANRLLDSHPVTGQKGLSQRKIKIARWNPKIHAARIKRILGNRVFPSFEAQLAADRADRQL
jgi:hypothetical protein